MPQEGLSMKVTAVKHDDERQLHITILVPYVELQHGVSGAIAYDISRRVTPWLDAAKNILYTRTARRVDEAIVSDDGVHIGDYQ